MVEFYIRDLDRRLAVLKVLEYCIKKIDDTNDSDGAIDFGSNHTCKEVIKIIKSCKRGN